MVLLPRCCELGSDLWTYHRHGDGAPVPPTSWSAPILTDVDDQLSLEALGVRVVGVLTGDKRFAFAVVPLAFWTSFRLNGEPVYHQHNSQTQLAVAIARQDRHIEGRQV